MNSKGSGRLLSSFVVGVVLVALAAGTVEAQSRRGGSRGGSRSSRYDWWRSRMADEIRRRTAAYLDNQPPPVEEAKPEKGQAMARFVKWTEGKDGRTPALMLVVSDEEGKKTFSLIVPNTKKSKTGEISPSWEIAAIAARLKIGDEVSVDYTHFKGRTTADGVKLTQSLSDSDNSPFTFVRAAATKRDGKKLLGLTAKRDKLSWTFLIPNEQVPASTFTGSDGKPLGEGMITVPAPRMLKCLSSIRSGDLISLEYTPEDYKFVLSDLQVSRISATGKFERLSTRLVGRKRHPMAMIRVGTRTLSLVLPLSEAKDGVIDNATRMIILLKDMRPWQAVDVQYRRQNGITWLDSISVKQ